MGRSEELIGEVLQEIDTKREDLVIATKGGNQWDSSGNVKKNNRPEYLRSALEASLRRLKTDYVDLYYLHFPDNEIPISESVGELSRLKEEGKIRAIGVSNLSLEQLIEADKTADISALQSGYNMLDRKAEAVLLPYCAENNISFIPYFPLASGLLSGKYRATGPRPKRFTKEEYERRIAIVDQLKEIADSKGMTLPNLALAWLLAQNGVEAVIPGGRRPEQVQGVVPAADIELTKDDLDRIAHILK